MAPNDNDLRSILRTLRRKIVQYLFLLLMTALFWIGLILVIVSAGWHLSEVWRDIGISMLIAGTVGLGVELFSRKEMEKVLGDLIEEKLTQATSDRLSALETTLQSIHQQTRIDAKELRQLQEDVFPRLEGIRDLVVRETGLQDVGLKRLSLRREQLLLEFVERAEPGSEIRMLALCLNTVANNDGRDLFKRKLRAGCRIRLLLLDPSMDAALEERARQENKMTDEDIQEFKERVRGWDSFHKNTVQKLAANKELPGSIDLGYYQSLPSCFMIDNGNAMLVGFYLHGCRGEQCPHLEIENKQNGLYQQFDRHFEALWVRRIVPFDRRHKEEPIDNERRRLRLA